MKHITRLLSPFKGYMILLAKKRLISVNATISFVENINAWTLIDD